MTRAWRGERGATDGHQAPHAASAGKQALTQGVRVQRKASASAPEAAKAPETSDAPVELAKRGVAAARDPLPYAEAIQACFGRHDVSQVRTATGGPAAASSQALGASAYAVGDRVGFAASPDLHTAAHEAAHVVQQRAGVQLRGGIDVHRGRDRAADPGRGRDPEPRRGGRSRGDLAGR